MCLNTGKSTTSTSHFQLLAATNVKQCKTNSTVCIRIKVSVSEQVRVDIYVKRINYISMEIS